MTSAVSVDASEAGAGNLEVVVRSTKTGARIPHFLEADDRSTGLFKIRFSPPPGCLRYEIDVSFNDLSVNGESEQFCLHALKGCRVPFHGLDNNPLVRECSQFLSRNALCASAVLATAIFCPSVCPSHL